MIELADKISNVDAARECLADIRQRHPKKLLTAEAVVRAAMAESHPLHLYFEWDDTEAAAQYRMAQARALIRSIEVTWVDNEERRKVPKYVSLRQDRKHPGGGYRDVREVVKSKKLLNELEETARRDLNALLHGRYEILKEFCERVRRAAGIKPKKKKSNT